MNFSKTFWCSTSSGHWEISVRCLAANSNNTSMLCRDQSNEFGMSLGAWLSLFPSEERNLPVCHCHVAPSLLLLSYCFFVLFCFLLQCTPDFTSACPFSAVHLQHASQVPGQQPAGAQQPSSSVEPHWTCPAGLQHRRPSSRSSAQVASSLHSIALDS